jgi:heme exporter protein D
MDLGPHASIIITCYVASAAAIAALIAWVVLDYRTQTRILADFETRGMTRRSERGRPSETLA